MLKFKARIPENFDEIMFCWWVEDENLDSALGYRDEVFFKFRDRVKGKVCEFILDERWPAECFEVMDNNFPIQVSMLEVIDAN